MHLIEWKMLFFYQIVTEVSSLWSNWQQASVGASNCLVPISRQAITWTHDDPIQSHSFNFLMKLRIVAYQNVYNKRRYLEYFTIIVFIIYINTY